MPDTTHHPKAQIPSDLGKQPLRLHRTPMLCAVTGFAPSTVERKIAEGKIAKADLKMGKHRVWRESTLFAILQNGVA
jgi:hypothetical protein